MAARRRRAMNAFSMSFLDVMACGFGATLLVWLLMDHQRVPAIRNNTQLTSEARLLEEDIAEGELGLVQLRTTIATIDDTLAQLRAQVSQLLSQIKPKQIDTPTAPKSADPRATTVALQTEITLLEKKLESLRSEGGTFGGANARAFTGSGDRQYLTGLRLGGEHIVILLDASASMLDDDLVNILRRRNMSESARRAAPKWTRAVRTVEWLSSQLPIASRFQIILFNENAKPALASSAGKWLPVVGGRDLEAAIGAVKDVVPTGGSSLENAFAMLQSMNPQPDNVYLVTDGLPTQGSRTTTGGTISGADRAELFNKAIAFVPKDTTVNTILLPMDGDYEAAAAYWILAQNTGGTMLTPSRDWP